MKKKIALFAAAAVWPSSPGAASFAVRRSADQTLAKSYSSPEDGSLKTANLYSTRYFKLTIAYDGTDFHGWQIQTGKPTIQGEIVDVLQHLTQEKIVLHGAGRTDAGVHALGQV